MLLKVEKMTCTHCVRTVTNAVKAVDPGAEVGVDLPNQQVRVMTQSDAEAIAAAIRAEGYSAAVIER
jgi:copper chaperone